MKRDLIKYETKAKKEEEKKQVNCRIKKSGEA
jgi:hypothetical protein